MADEESEQLDDAGDGENDEVSKGSGKGKLIIIIVAVVVVLLLGGAATAYFFGLFDSNSIDQQNLVTKAGEVPENDFVAPAFFYELPEIAVNLNTIGRKAARMKLSVSIEVSDPELIPKLEALLPRIIDNFQVYLRELRVADLRGSAGMYRLREELLTRVNSAIAPSKVKAILFREMLVQ
jgi:flagellar protein FliL